MTTNSSQDTSERIRQYLVQHFRNHVLKDDEDIFALGFVTSLFAMQLVMFVEKEFGIQIESDDLEIDNFRSVNALTSLVDRKRERSTIESGRVITT